MGAENLDRYGPGMGSTTRVQYTRWGDTGVDHIAPTQGVTAMQIIVSALIALSVLAGIAAPASALDAKSFYEQQERNSGG